MAHLYMVYLGLPMKNGDFPWPINNHPVLTLPGSHDGLGRAEPGLPSDGRVGLQFHLLLAVPGTDWLPWASEVIGPIFGPNHPVMDHDLVLKNIEKPW